ncbi:MAG: hypothetical protein R3E82_03735 [Pseudomonadales bacterium]
MNRNSSGATTKDTSVCTGILAFAVLLLATATGCDASENKHSPVGLVGGIDLIPEFMMVGEVEHLIVQGNYAYGNTLDKLLIVDISNPAAPVKAGEINISELSRIRALVVRGSDLLIAAGPNNGDVYLYLADTSDHGHLQIRGRVKIYDKVRDHLVPSPVEELSIVVGDNHIYVIGFAELKVIDVFDLSEPRLIADTSELSGNLALKSSSRYWVRLSSDYDGSFLRVFDSEEESNPKVVGKVNLGELDITAAASVQNFVYIGARVLNAESGQHYNGLFVYDISEPSSPQRIGESNLGAGLMVGTHQGAQTMSMVAVTDIVVSGSYAYIAESHAGIKVVDVSNPAAPEYIATLETRISATDLATDGRYLYAVNNNKFISPFDLMIFQLMPDKDITP